MVTSMSFLVCKHENITKRLKGCSCGKRTDSEVYSRTRIDFEAVRSTRMGGAVKYISAMLGGSHKHKKMKQLQTVELKVRMDCEGCEHKVKRALSSLKGVKSVDVDRKQQKVTVIGYIEAKKVLKRVKSTGKKAELWPYVPYHAVAQPYTAQAYDKKAPPGYVRNVDAVAASNTDAREVEQYTAIFSDENAKACSIM